MNHCQQLLRVRITVLYLFRLQFCYYSPVIASPDRQIKMWMFGNIGPKLQFVIQIC